MFLSAESSAGSPLLSFSFSLSSSLTTLTFSLSLSLTTLEFTLAFKLASPLASLCALSLKLLALSLTCLLNLEEAVELGFDCLDPSYQVFVVHGRLQGSEEVNRMTSPMHTRARGRSRRIMRSTYDRRWSSKGEF